MSIASALREIAAILEREANAIDGIMGTLPAPNPLPGPHAPVAPPDAPANLPSAGAFPAIHVPGTVRANLVAGWTYRCYFPEAGGYAISVEQGRGARINVWQEGTPEPRWDDAAVDSGTIMSGPQQAWLVKADRDCQVAMSG